MKKITAQAYAQAFLETSGHALSDQAKFLKRFIAVIKKNGDWSRAPQIMKAVETAWRRKHERPLVTIESARPLSREQLANLKKGLHDSGKMSAFDIEEKLRPELIAGVRLTIDDEQQLDASLQQLMKQVFAHTS